MELSFGIRQKLVTCKACGSDSHSMCQPDRPMGGTIRLYRPSLEAWYKRKIRLARMSYRRKLRLLLDPIATIRRPAVIQRSVYIHQLGHNGWVGLKDFDSCRACWHKADSEITTAYACRVFVRKILGFSITNT